MADLDEIIRDVTALLRQSPQGKRGRVRVSAEFAAWLEQAPGTAAEPAAAPAPEPALSEAAPSNWSDRQPSAPEAPSAPKAPPSVQPAAKPKPVPLPELTGDRVADLAALAERVAGCTLCELCESRKQTVFSDGSPTADVVFVGEAPGADEDAQGVPFVGRAGQLLTRIIERVMKRKREEVYICNVLKCRPPGNRDPKASEKAACIPYLSRQLALVKPKVIVALGRHAANTLLGTEESTGRLRGRWHFYEGIPLRVTYHPAYILRCEGDPARERTEKAKVKADIDEVMRVLSGEIAPSPGDA